MLSRLAMLDVKRLIHCADTLTRSLPALLLGSIWIKRLGLYLEVAEDYAIVANNALKGVQVKDTNASGSVTLNSKGVRESICSYVDLLARNPSHVVELRFFTTSPIGTELRQTERPAGKAGLVYWRMAASGAEVTPLRTILDSEAFPDSVRKFVRSRDDDAFRRELLQKIHWDCGGSLT